MKRNWYYIFTEINHVLGSALLIFLGIEIVKPKLVSAYINLNLWFIFWLTSAIIILILNNSLINQEAKK